MAETLLKCTTRHVRLFTARVVNDDLVASDDELTLDLDPDNDFHWSDAAVAKVQQQFRSLVESAGSGELSDYTLRRIGTDLEGFIRQLLQAGELRYNPDGRVQNFSMGLPRTPELLLHLPVTTGIPASRIPGVETLDVAIHGGAIPAITAMTHADVQTATTAGDIPLHSPANRGASASAR